MAIPKTCPNCELYYICLQGYKKLPANEEGCEDWELAFRVYQDMTKEETKEYLNEIAGK